MGNLATEEILRKLGEDVKSIKPKKNQKSCALQKDSAKNAKAGGGNGKKHRDKRPQMDKETTKGSGASSNSPSPSPKHNKSGSEKHIEGRIRPTDVTNDINNKGASSFSVAVGAGEDDDEEQYVSADEGVNSVASDEVYHTDELSVSSSHDLMNDAGNYRADDEEVILNRYTIEEPEFIQVTAKSRKKSANNAYGDKKTSSGSNETTSSSRQCLAYTDINQRRNSGQLIVDSTSGHVNQQAFQNEHKRFIGSLARRQLNSLADYIEDSTVHQGKTRKNSHHANSKMVGNQQSFKLNVTTERNKNTFSENFDRRSSQSICQSGRYAAAVIHNTQGSSHSFPVSSNTIRSSSPQHHPLVSPALSSVDSLTHKSKRLIQAYDQADERAIPPLLSAVSSTNLTDMTHTACITVTGSNCAMSSSAARSYAEIAKRKSPVVPSTVSHTAVRDASPESCVPSTSTNNDERCTSVTSSAGGSVEIIDKDSNGSGCSTQQLNNDFLKGSAVDGFSFFYDPNEPTTICDTQPTLASEENENRDFFSPSTPTLTKFGGESKREKAERTNGKAVVKREECVEICDIKPDITENKLIKLKKEADSSFVLKLKLESGRTILLPSMNVGGTLEVDRKKKEMMNDAWKSFIESGPAPVRYKPGVLQSVSTTGDN